MTRRAARAGSGGSPRKRGRPPGSVSLTQAKADQIILLLRGATSLRTAAEISGVSLRTLQGWIARGEGRSQKPVTPKLKKFAQAVRRAQAEAQASAEVRVHEHQPATWLRLLGATATEPEDAPDIETPSPERIKDLARRFRDLMLLIDPAELVPRCPNPRCRCIFHRERTPDELAATRAIASKRVGP